MKKFSDFGINPLEDRHIFNATQVSISDVKAAWDRLQERFNNHAVDVPCSTIESHRDYILLFEI